MFLEIVLILIVVLLLFGGSRLPRFGRGLGKAVQEFRRSYCSGEDSQAQDKGGKDRP